MTASKYLTIAAVLVLMLFCRVVGADAIVVSQAMFADTIAEYMVEEDHVRIELEIGGADIHRLLADAGAHGAGKRYLIQHSAGSGKSNSIAWLAHQLIGLTKDDNSVFDSIIVVTDRRILDKQIRDTIKQYAQVSATMGHADHSSDLRGFIESGKKIMFCSDGNFDEFVDDIAATGVHGFVFEPLTDLADTSERQEQVDRLRELWSQVREARIRADLELGRHRQVLGELERGQVATGAPDHVRDAFVTRRRGEIVRRVLVRVGEPGQTLGRSQGLDRQRELVEHDRSVVLPSVPADPGGRSERR